MNISLQNVDKVSAVLTAKVEKNDYQANVEKALKNLRQKVNMPGFRKGMVPMSLVKKQYGISVLVEEVDKLLREKVSAYLSENKVNMLGSPLPKPSDVDFEKGEDFEFAYDIALAPEFEVTLSDKDKVDYYDIEVSDDMVNQQVEMYRQRSAKYEQVDEYADGDMLKGVLAELDENGKTKEGGVLVPNAVMSPNYMKNDEQKAIFAKAKKNSVLVFNPSVAFDNNEAELASLLAVKKEEVAAHNGNFSFQINEITRAVPADLTTELFDTVLGEGKAKTEEEFRAALKAGFAQQFEADSNYKFLLDLRAYLTKKVGKLEFSEPLLKRIMLENNEDKGEKYVEENYAKSLEELVWHLIKEKLVAANNIKVEQKDVEQMAIEATRAQFAQFGMMNVPDEVLENYSKEMLKRRENVDGLVNRAIESKLAEAVKGIVKLNHKAISVEDFNKMFQ